MSDRCRSFLLVDDDADYRFLVEREFRNRPGSLLKSVCDGEQAMAYLEGQEPYTDRTACPLPDIILLDIKMPRMDGFAFLTWLRSSAPPALRKLPVVVLSSSTLPEDMRKAYELGANSYVGKSAEFDDLKKALEALSNYWTCVEKAPDTF